MTAMPTTLKGDFDLSSHNGTTAGLKLGGTLVTATAAELNAMDGVTSSAAELNILTGVTATAAEINLNDLSVVGALVKVKKIALTAATHGTGSEVNTSFVLPTKCIVLDAYIDVTTAEVTGATKTLDVGTNVSGSDDADGFLDGVSVAATGVKKGVTTYTVGLNEEYAASTTKGVLLEKFRAGSDLALDVGIARGIFDITSGGSTVSVTSGSAFTEFAGSLYIVYIEIA